MYDVIIYILITVSNKQFQQIQKTDTISELNTSNIFWSKVKRRLAATNTPFSDITRNIKLDDSAVLMYLLSIHDSFCLCLILLMDQNIDNDVIRKSPDNKIHYNTE